MLAHLLPDPAHLRLECLCAETDLITVIVSTKGSQAQCPLCHHSAHRIHSRYIRTLADLPWNAVAVRLRLTVRRGNACAFLPDDFHTIRQCLRLPAG